MSDLIPEDRPRRKVLSLRLEPTANLQKQSEPQFVINREAVYMVWCDDGDMPKRVYRSSERDKAVGHAKILAGLEGKRFHVLRSFRAFDPEGGE